MHLTPAMQQGADKLLEKIKKKIIMNNLIKIIRNNLFKKESNPDENKYYFFTQY